MAWGLRINLIGSEKLGGTKERDREIAFQGRKKIMTNRAVEGRTEYEEWQETGEK